MENTSDSFKPGPLLFCMKIERSVCYKVTDNKYTPEQLTNSLHSYLLPESDSVIWRLNYKQMGLGGDNSWGAKLLDKYQIQANQTYSYTYTLKPISTSDVDASMEESKVVLP